MLKKIAVGNGAGGIKAENTSKKKETSHEKKKVLKNLKIFGEEDYKRVMQQIDEMMRIGEDNLNAEQMKELHALSAAAESFEDKEQPLPVPAKLPDIIELRLFQMKINRSKAAQLLGVSDAKFSLIMNAKQKPDVDFLTAVNTRLKVDANFLLNSVAQMNKTRKANHSDTVAKSSDSFKTNI